MTAAVSLAALGAGKTPIGLAVGYRSSGVNRRIASRSLHRRRMTLTPFLVLGVGAFEDYVGLVLGRGGDDLSNAG